MIMNWNNNDTKYIIKKLIIYFLIAFAMFIFGIFNAKADTLAPSILQYYKPNRNLTWTRSPVEFSQQGQKFYHTSTSSVNDIAGLYGIVNNQISGTYFSFNALVPPHDYWVVGELQLLDGSFVACETNAYTAGGTETGFYTFTCEVKQPVQVYKYGVYLTSTTGYGETENSVSLSSLNGFSDRGEYNQYLINLQNSILGVETKIDANTQAINNVNNSINNDNITSGDADTFANNSAFNDTTGLESVINLPLNMVNSLSNQCQPIQIHIPYLETDATIPCMSTIYSSKFNSLYTLVKLVINGFLVYRILLKVYELVHEAKQPDMDKLEVIEL